MVDIKITIKIDSAKVQEFRDAFNKVVLRPPQYEGLTDVQFLKMWVKDSIFNVYKTGKIQIAQGTTKPSIDLNIVVVT